MSRIERVLLLSDIQLRPATDDTPSGEDVKTLQAVEAYVRDQKWDQVVQVGDLVDLDCISSHNAGKPKLVEGRRLQRDYDHANRWLDRWQEATPGAKWTILEGNHEFRATRYAQAFPAMEGKVEVPENLHLKARGINWVPYWSKGELYQIGNAYVGHGRSTSQYHAAKHLRDYGVCLFYGHTHDVQEHSIVTFGNDKTLAAKSIGCLCRYDQPYLNGRPTKWQQAFSQLHVRPNGYFQEYTTKIFDHTFVSPEGELYRGR